MGKQDPFRGLASLLRYNTGGQLICHSYSLLLLALDAGQSDTLNKGTLGKEEYDDHRDQHYRAGGHQRPILGTVLTLEERQSQRDSVLVRIAEEDERSQKVTPGG